MLVVGIALVVVIGDMLARCLPLVIAYLLEGLVGFWNATARRD